MTGFTGRSYHGVLVGVIELLVQFIVLIMEFSLAGPALCVVMLFRGLSCGGMNDCYEGSSWSR